MKDGLAGLFSDCKRSPQDTLKHFLALCSNNDTKWNIKHLQSFCRTRRIGYNDSKSRQLSVDKLLPRIQIQLEIESLKGRPTYIHCPTKSQLPLRQRRLTLVKHGILNINNYRRVVKSESPDKTDTSWRYLHSCMFVCMYTQSLTSYYIIVIRYVRRDDLTGMGFPEIAFQWFADFTPNWRRMWTKGATCFWEGRAYDFRWIDRGDTRWFRYKTKRTMLKGAMSIIICFHRYVFNLYCMMSL